MRLWGILRSEAGDGDPAVNDRTLPPGIESINELACGCGTPSAFWDAVQAILEHFEQPIMERDHEWVCADRFRYFAVNALDSCGVIEHGSGIAGSWLTDSGKEALAFLRQYGLEWPDRGEVVWLDSQGVIQSRMR